jgi:hypothetical protein
MNRTNNPAKSPDARAKLSQQARATGQQKRLMTPAARAKALPKLGNGMRGKKQSVDTIERKISSWKRSAEQYGGMTPAHKAQLERLHKEYSGENHPNWQGGITNERRKDYRSPQYVAFRNGVLTRDDYTCQTCGKRGGRLEVHHAHVAYAQCVGDLQFLRYHLANGQTLCRSCHNKTKTTRPDLEKPAFSQLPQHIIDLIRSQIGS